jgi:hypothetical protein
MGAAPPGGISILSKDPQNAMAILECVNEQGHAALKPKPSA